MGPGAPRLWRVAVRLVTTFATMLVLGTIPGAVTRPVVYERDTVRLAPAPDHDVDLEVRVRSSSDHRPLPRARVRVFAILDGRAYLAGSGDTDSLGRVTLGSLPAAATWILADADGYARASTQRVLTRAEPPLELGLAQGHTLGVLVTDDLSQPVPGAEVEASSGDPLPVGAKAGADGRAVVTRLAEGPWTVAVRAPGFEDVVRRGVREGETPNIVLRKLGAIVVTVVRDHGEPAPLAHVQIAGTSLWPARMTDTAADGRVRISGLAAGSYALRATSAGLVSQTDLGIPLARGEERAVTLTLAPGVFGLAKVMDGDADDALPISRARVTLVEGGLSPFPLEAVSDEIGSVRLGPVVAGPALLSAQAEGYVPRGGVEMPLDGHVVTLVMLRAGVVLGRVFDGRGRPVDGASIAVVGTSLLGVPIEDDPQTQSFRRTQFDTNLLGTRTLIPSGELGVVPGPVPTIPRAFDMPPASGPGAPSAPPSLEEPWVTKEDGTFHLTPVSPGRVRLVVRHPEFLEALSDAVTLAPGGEAHVNVVLRVGGTLEGRVLDASGRPVSGANVTVAALRGSTERSTRSASDGTFAFAAVPDGVVVTANLGEEGDARVARSTLSVPEAGRAQVTLTLPDARPPLEVRVRDDRGYPIGAAQISAGSVDPATPFRTTAFTDAEGAATIPGARGIALRLEVSAPGHSPRAAEVSPTESSAEVTLGPAETVSGAVREARSGAPVRAAEVTLYSSAGVVHAETDAEGRFKLRDVAPGEARLRIRARERVTTEQRVTVTDTASRAQDLGSIDLAEEGVVEGTVVDARGEPVAGARVGKDRVSTYVPAKGRDATIAVTDGRGRFHLGGLEEGEVTLEAYAPDVGRGRAEGVRTTAGRTVARVTIRLSPEEAGAGVDPGSSGGVAVTLGEVGGEPVDVVVLTVADGSEAERAGLVAGDVLVAVDAVAVRSIVEARTRLSGPVGDDVVVTRRRADRTEALRVPREPVRR